MLVGSLFVRFGAYATTVSKLSYNKNNYTVTKVLKNRYLVINLTSGILQRFGMTGVSWVYKQI